MDELNQNPEKLRRILLSAEVDRKKKVKVLRQLMELRGDPSVCAIVREATQAPVNERLLNYFVRVLGYFNDPEVLTDLAGFLVHRRKLVARNAAKAMVSFDPESAVEVVMRLLRTAPLKNMLTAIKVLAERCPREAGPAIEKLLGSRSRRERLIAVIFLHHAVDLEAVGRLLELMRTEREPAIIDWAFKALDQQATRAHQTPVDQLRTELWAKSERLRELAAQLPERLEPLRGEAPRSESRKLFLPPVEPLPADTTATAASQPEPFMKVPGPFDAPRPPRSSGAIPAVRETPAKDSRKLLPWQEKERKAALKRSRKDRAGVFRACKRKRSLQALAAAVLVVGVAIAGWLAMGHVPQPPRVGTKQPIVDVATSPLGAVNAKVQFVGQIAEVHADYNTMLVRTKDGTLASVRFPDSIVSFTSGRTVQIDGTIREVRGGICVVDGSTAHEP